MSKKKNKVILFEDDPKSGPEITKAIRKRLAVGAELVRFEPCGGDDDRAYEDRLREELSSPTYANATLIVCDRDLTKTTLYRGLSEAVVSNVAAELGVPLCLYARGDSDDLLERQRNWGDGRIVLDSQSIDGMARKIAVLTQGFAEVRDTLWNMLARRGDKIPKTPASILAQILDRPELADQIALYGMGDQKMVAQILPDYQKKKRRQKKEHRVELRERLPCLLGYWLYDSILRFPGLLVNTVAAASYLNIVVKAFQKDAEVRKLFSSALYAGPFRDPAEPLWWRGRLGDLLLTAGCTDGRSLVQKKLGRTVRFCACSLDPKKVAGYYCMATNKPVSLENSYGNISWFPQGADLARIGKNVYEEIGPWLGLF